MMDVRSRYLLRVQAVEKTDTGRVQQYSRRGFAIMDATGDPQ